MIVVITQRNVFPPERSSSVWPKIVLTDTLPRNTCTITHSCNVLFVRPVHFKYARDPKNNLSTGSSFHGNV